MSDAWVTFDVTSAQLARANFHGLPVVVRGTTVTCPPDAESAVRARLGLEPGQPTPVEWSGVGPEGPPTVTRFRPLSDVSAVPVPSTSASIGDGESAPKEPVTRDVIDKISDLEVQVFDLMVHRDKILSKITDDRYDELALFLGRTFDKKFKSYKDEIEKNKRIIEESLSSLISVASKNKVAEYERKALRNSIVRLDSPSSEEIKDLEVSVKRMQAIGFETTLESFKTGIISGLESKLNCIAPENTSSFTDKLIKAEKALEVAILAFGAIKDSKGELRVETKKIVEGLAGLEFVKELKIDERGITVITKDVIITEPDTKYTGNLGSYKIYIGVSNSPNSESVYSVSIINLTYGDSKSHQHPHIRGGWYDSSICWGNIRGSIYKLLEEWDFLMFFTLAWNFLNAYNGMGAYIRLNDLATRFGIRLVPPKAKLPSKSTVNTSPSLNTEDIPF